MKTYLQVKGEGAAGLVVAAGGPHEEFQGPSWQLESSPHPSPAMVCGKR